MTEPARPEPVLQAAKLGGLVAAVVVAIGAVVTLVLAGRWTDINALGTTLGALAGAIMALVAYVAPVWQARKARAKVTPLDDPRDDDGTPLVAALGDGMTGEPYVADDGAVLIPGRTPPKRLVTGRPAQVPGEADHSAEGPRSEAARHAALNDESPQG